MQETAKHCLVALQTTPQFQVVIKSHPLCPYVYNKENLERQETNKYGRGTERHLPKTDDYLA